MGNDPEKERVSADIVRPISDPPILPTVNPALEKVEPPASKIHPAVYIVSVSSPWLLRTVSLLTRHVRQYLDFPQLNHNSVQ